MLRRNAETQNFAPSRLCEKKNMNYILFHLELGSCKSNN
jgi:hypothetical protein